MGMKRADFDVRRKAACILNQHRDEWVRCKCCGLPLSWRGITFDVHDGWVFFSTDQAYRIIEMPRQISLWEAQEEKVSCN